MSLVAVCPECSSKFVVGQDQLAAQQGRVRCGHCGQVFNALHHLYQTAPDAPAEDQASAPAPAALSEDESTVAPVQQASDSPDEQLASTATATTDVTDTSSAESDAESALDGQLGADQSTPDATTQDQAAEADAPAPADDAPAPPHTPEDEIIPWPLLPADDVAETATKDEETLFAPSEDAAAGQHDQLASDAEAYTDRDDTVLEQSTHDDTTSVALTPGPDAPEYASEAASTAQQASTDPVAAELPPVDNASYQAAPDHLPADSTLIVATSIETAPAAATLADQVPSMLKDVHDGDKTAARPRRRWPTWLWVLLLAILLAAALAQTLYFMRTQVATVWPATKPALVQACRWLGCKVELPAIADLLAIDDSDLKEDTERTGLIHLTSTVINNAPFAQAYPRLELTLTDVNDKPVLRRTFQPAEYLPAGTDARLGIPAGDEVHIHLALSASGAPVVGYRVFVKYD